MPLWYSSLRANNQNLSLPHLLLAGVPLPSVPKIVSCECEIRVQTRIKILHLCSYNCLIPISREAARIRCSCLLYYKPGEKYE